MTLRAIPDVILEQLRIILPSNLKKFEFCSGGCINQGGKLSTDREDFFIKWNDHKKYPHMFEAEAKGLSTLREPQCIDVPQVIATGQAGDFQYIVMQFIEDNGKATDFWTKLGEQLASLHRNYSPAFGLDHDNFIGSLQQINTPRENWIDFFIHNRLEVQLKLATDQGHVGREVTNNFQLLYKKFPEILPVERPALLHGDLWSGNLITNAQGAPCLIDPAVYYGNREAEIAFTMLFGGFAPAFYQSYEDNYPFFPGFSARSNVYNLYPLLVHFNLFGGGYLSQVVSILRHFV